MSVLDQIKGHFEARSMERIEVAEWGAKPGEPLVILYKTPNPNTWSAIIKDSGGDPIKQMAVMVARCALNEAGERVFGNLDWKELMVSAHPDVLARVAAAMSKGARIDVDSAEKN